eukprot:c10723_g1_i1 orf=803-1087(+)
MDALLQDCFESLLRPPSLGVYGIAVALADVVFALWQILEIVATLTVDVYDLVVGLIAVCVHICVCNRCIPSRGSVSIVAYTCGQVFAGYGCFCS